MKTVLMITYEFPPVGGSGVQRSLYFAKYLARFGWRPVIVQADRFIGENTDARLLAELPAGIKRRTPPNRARVPRECFLATSPKSSPAASALAAF